MYKTKKILICLFIISLCSVFFQFAYAKYVIDISNVIARLNIDRCKPNIHFLDISTSNTDYYNYVNSSHLITVYIKIEEKHLVRNDLSPNTIKILVDKTVVTPTFLEYSLVSENANEKIYKFTFTNTLGNGYLSIEIPSNVLEDQSGLTNGKKTFLTNINVDNIAPSATLQETVNSDGSSSAN